jgi:dihydrofolate reductase
MIISIIVAVDEKNGIGKNNQLLCHLPADLKYFKQTTSGHHIVMGRNTYESIGRPLPNRVNVVVTRNKELEIAGCVIKHSLQEAIDFAKAAGETELFITGGGTIYKESMQLAHRIYITRISHQFEADTFFPDLDANWKLEKEEMHSADEKNAYSFLFQMWSKN